MNIHPKVLAAAGGATVGAGVGAELGSALGTILAWGLSLHGVQMPEPVQNAFGVVFGALVSGGMALAAGYMQSAPAQEPAASNANETNVSTVAPSTKT